MTVTRRSLLAGILASGIAHFKPPKSKQHLVSVVLAETDGKQVTHTAVD